MQVHICSAHARLLCLQVHTFGHRRRHPLCSVPTPPQTLSETARNFSLTPQRCTYLIHSFTIFLFFLPLLSPPLPSYISLSSEPTHSLSLVPQCRITHELLRASGELEFEGEAKHTVHRLEEVQTPTHLLHNLRRGRGRHRYRRPHGYSLKKTVFPVPF